MKKLLYLSLLAVNCSLLTASTYAACESGYVEINNASVIYATDSACQSGFVDITNNSVKPATGVSGSDDKGAFTYMSCP